MNPLRHVTTPGRAWYSAPFYPLIGQPPLEHTRDAADAYWHRVWFTLHDRALSFTKHDRRNLQRIERRWRRRALGVDARWLEFGSRRGRLPPAIERRYRPAPDPLWTAPVQPMVRRPLTRF